MGGVYHRGCPLVTIHTSGAAEKTVELSLT